MSTSTTPRRFSNTQRLAAGVAGGALVLLGGGYAAGYALAGDSVPRNASVAGVALGGLSREAAIAKLTAELGPSLARDVVVTVGDKQTAATPAELGLSVDYAASVDQTGVGRSFDPVHILTVLTGGTSQPAVFQRDQAKLDAALDGLAGHVGDPAVNATLAVKDGALAITPGTPGQSLDRTGTVAAVTAGLFDGKPIPAVVTTADPEVTTSDAETVKAQYDATALTSPIAVAVADKGTFKLSEKSLAKALSFAPEGGTLVPVLDGKTLVDQSRADLAKLGLKSPKDATITIAKGKPKIVASVDGQGVAADQLATAAAGVLGQGSGRSVSVNSAPLPAAFTTDDAKALGVKQVTGKFTTYFPGTAYRWNNLPKAARLINGTFLKPGETFSMNKTLGERTVANGWMAGGAIDGGKVVTRLGGGISQATTTTFNAIFFAGLKDIYHKPHSLYFNRYPVGREATLDWVSVDMKFKNDSPYGVVLQAYTTGKYPNQGAITVKVWSTKVYTIKSSPPVRSNYRAPGATIYDDSPGCIPQSAMTGFDVRFKRLFYKDGKLVKREPFFHAYNSLTPVVCGAKP